MNFTAYLTPSCMYCGSDAESIAIAVATHPFGNDPICCEI